MEGRSHTQPHPFVMVITMIAVVVVLSLYAMLVFTVLERLVK